MWRLKSFDKFYLLLIFPVLRLTMPFLQYRFRSWTLAPFVVAWFIRVFQDRRYVISDSAMNRHYLATCFWLAFYFLQPFFFGLLGSNPELVKFRPLGEGGKHHCLCLYVSHRTLFFQMGENHGA